MVIRSRVLSNSLVLAAACLLGAASSASSQTPQANAISSFTNANAYAQAASDTGVVVGFDDTGNVVWTPTLGTFRLDLGGGPNQTSITDLSRSGIAVGTAVLAGGSTQHAFVWTEQEGLLDIGTLPATTTSSAMRVSDNGVVIGTSDNQTFAWTRDAGFVNLDAFTGSPFPLTVTGLNSTGMVVGWFREPSEFAYRAFAWSLELGFRDLGTLGGGVVGVPGSDWSKALGINDAGMVFGQATRPGGTFPIAFVWTASAGMVAIDVPNTNSVLPKDMSNSGIVVGTFELGGITHAFYWASAQGLSELPGLGGSSTTPWWVSDDGIVTGFGTLSGTNESRSIIWVDGSPVVVPLPPNTGFISGASTCSSVQTGMCLRRAISRNGVVPAGNYAWSRQTGFVQLSASAVTINAITDDGVIAGGGYVGPDSYWRPFIWSPSRGLALLGLPGGTFAEGHVYGLSQSGVAAGQAWDPTYAVALVWQTAPANISPTPTGSGVTNQPTATLPDGSTSTVGITFSDVTGAGQTTVTTTTSGPPPPDGFKIAGGQQPIYYDVSTTATFTGTVTVCFSWQEGQLRNENNARLFHYESNQWKDITTSVDTAGNKVCGTTSSLSPFFIGEQRVFGFYAPIDNAPVVNSMKAGAAVPVKFSLGSNEGLSIFSAGYPLSQPAVCSSGALVDNIEQTMTAGSSALSYDATTGQYSYTWKTDKAWAGTCRQLSLKLLDGTVKTAQFKFTK